MKRELIFGVFLGVLLAAGGFWVAFSGSLFPTTTSAASTQAGASIQMTQPLAPAAQTQTAPLAPQALEALSADELQALIVFSGQYAVKSAIRRAGPAVVQIDVTSAVDSRNSLNELFQNDPFYDYFFNQPPSQRQTTSLGSGFFIEFEGRIYLLTNNHVAENASSIRVTTEESWQFSAKVIGSDAQIDVAVLQIDDFKGKSMPTVTLGDSDSLEIGDWVVAIGNPLGLTHTVTAGIVSALGRNIDNPNASSRFRSLIQTDAAINPGNSGGPLVNARGEVVGINTLIASDAEGLNFAININEVKQVLSNLIREGKVTRAWLGVYIQPLTEELARQFNVPGGQGVLIGDVVPAGPSEGVLQSGDVVTHVDGVAVGSVNELQDEVMFKGVGQTVKVDLIRAGQPLTLEMTLAAKPSDEELASTLEPQDDAADAVEKFGMRVSAITPDLAEQLQLDSARGVVVMEVEPGSRAHWGQVQLGDVIVGINRQPIRGIEEWNLVVGSLGSDASLLLTVKRGGRTVYIALY